MGAQSMQQVSNSIFQADRHIQLDRTNKHLPLKSLDIIVLSFCLPNAF